MLLEMGQSHLFESWEEPGIDDEEKRGFFDQVYIFEDYEEVIIYNLHSLVWNMIIHLSYYQRCHLHSRS